MHRDACQTRQFQSDPQLDDINAVVRKHGNPIAARYSEPRDSGTDAISRFSKLTVGQRPPRRLHRNPAIELRGGSPEMSTQLDLHDVSLPVLDLSDSAQGISPTPIFLVIRGPEYVEDF
jgi:hypothetical protein